MIAESFTYTQEVGLRAAEALFTAAFVGIVAGVVTHRVQGRIEKSRADRERLLDQRWAGRERLLDERWADQERALDEQKREAEYKRDLDREERQLRRELVRRASEVLGGFYFTTQAFWRQRQNADVWGPPDDAQLDSDYVDWAKVAEAFEREVAAIFGWNSKPWELVHQCRNLLTVRYFDLRGRDSEALRRNNAKGKDNGFHSGMSATQLKDRTRVLGAYRDCMKSVVDEMLTARVVDEWPTEADVRRASQPLLGRPRVSDGSSDLPAGGAPRPAARN